MTSSVKTLIQACPQLSATNNGGPTGEVNHCEVLDEFDGPMLFRYRVGSENYLAYRFSHDDDQYWCIVVPITDGELHALVEGSSFLRSALDHPLVYIVAFDCELNPTRAWVVARHAIPANWLPMPECTLSAATDPLLTIKGTLREDQRRPPIDAVTAILKSVRGMLHSTYRDLHQGSSRRGTSSELRFYNIPVQSIGENGLSISFSDIQESVRDALSPAGYGLDDHFARVKDRIRSFFDIFHGTHVPDVSLPDDVAVVRGCRPLLPPPNGALSRVHCSGSLVRRFRSGEPVAKSLNLTPRERARMGLFLRRANSDAPTGHTFRGRISRMDRLKDRDASILHIDSEEGGRTQRVLVPLSALFVNIFEAFRQGDEVVCEGQLEDGSIRAVSILPVSYKSA